MIKEIELQKRSIAILIPCYNEEISIKKVVEDFKEELPSAKIYVYDNASIDNTYSIIETLNINISKVNEKGKGNVVREMFSNIEADFYIMVDGDDTYPANKSKEMLFTMINKKVDMVVGDRHSNNSYKKENKRSFHNFGNNLVKKIINFIYKRDLQDIMSGYRVFSKRFILLLPDISNGFEIETEFTMHALDKKFKICEIPIEYKDRTNGSYSKLNTYLDGIKVLKTIVTLFKDYKPLYFFFLLSCVFFIFSIVIGIPVISEFVKTGYIHKIPSAILASGMMLLSFISIFSGFILDTLAKQNRSLYERLKRRENNR